MVAVILVNWNRPHDTLECLRSLWASTYPCCEIIVVDNGSTDDSLALLRSEKGPFILLENSENLGFTGGNNRGIRYALERGADYVFLLNNDTVIASDALERLVRAAERDTTLGIVSPKIRFYSPPENIWFGGGAFSNRFLSGRMIGYGLEDYCQYDQECDTAFVSGCAMLIRGEAVRKVGLLDEDFFAVLEDIDYSLRAVRKGYRLRYIPTAVVWHKESSSAGGHDAPQYVYYQTRNFILLHRRWSSGRYQYVVSEAYAFLYFVKRALRFAWQRKWASILGILYGVRDGIIRQYGRREYHALSNAR